MKIALISLLDSVMVPSLRYLSSYTKKHGHEVYLIFFPCDLTQKNKAELIKLLNNLVPDIVGLSIFTDYTSKGIQFTQIIRSSTKALITWGGPHPSILPEACLEYADVVFREESEDAFLKLIQKLETTKDFSDVPNIVYKKNGQIIKNELGCLLEDLDGLPYQDYDTSNHFLFNKDGFQIMTPLLLNKLLRGEINTVFSRGCPYSCSYCYNQDKRTKYRGKGKYVRTMSIERMINELKYLKDKFGFFEYVVSWDDNFLLRSEEDIKRFAELYKRDINLPLSCLVHPNYVTEGKIRLLKEKCRLFHVQIGLEAGSDNINRDIYQRVVTSKKFVESIKILHKQGVSIHMDVLFNNPFESIGDIKETINVLLQVPKPFSINGNSLIFFPGTEIYRMAVKGRFITPKEGKIEIGKGNVFATVLDFDKGVKDNPFYYCNFSDAPKKYYNILILLTARLPGFLIKYFMDHDTAFNRGLIEKIYAAQEIIIDKIPQVGFDFVNRHIFKPTKVVRTVRNFKHKIYEGYYRLTKEE